MEMIITCYNDCTDINRTCDLSYNLEYLYCQRTLYLHYFYRVLQQFIEMSWKRNWTLILHHSPWFYQSHFVHISPRKLRQITTKITWENLYQNTLYNILYLKENGMRKRYHMILKPRWWECVFFRRLNYARSSR